jgi:hypothetical protein
MSGVVSLCCMQRQMDDPANMKALTTRYGAVWSAGSVCTQWRGHKSVSLEEISLRPLAHKATLSPVFLKLPPPTPVTLEGHLNSLHRAAYTGRDSIRLSAGHTDCRDVRPGMTPFGSLPNTVIFVTLDHEGLHSALNRTQ